MINATGKIVANEMLDITEYIKNIDIKEAKRQGIRIKSVRCQAHPIERGGVLDTNIEKWIKNEEVLLNQRAWSIRFSEKDRNKTGRSSRKASHIVIEQTFSNFRIMTKTAYEARKYYLMFAELNEYEESKCKKHPKYNPQGTPTMMQIAFGMIKKYKELDVEVRGYIPGINEPSEYEKYER